MSYQDIPCHAGRMTPSSWAGVIGAVGSVLTAAGILVTAIRLILPLLRQAQEIHTIVNQQRTDMLIYQRELIDALAAHGITVPKDRSLPNE